MELKELYDTCKAAIADRPEEPASREPAPPRYAVICYIDHELARQALVYWLMKHRAVEAEGKLNWCERLIDMHNQYAELHIAQARLHLDEQEIRAIIVEITGDPFFDC